MSVFIEAVDRQGDVRLKELVRDQLVLRAILEPFLHKVQYAKETLTAMCWRPFDGVAVDPQRQFGKPIVESVGVPTSILAASYVANQQDASIVADWYEISPRDVKIAVRFEREWFGAVA
jgi:uncharacterized protein (DUF433 family)